MRKHGLILALASITALSVACVPSERDLGGSYSGDIVIESAVDAAPLESVSDARVLGDMGQVRNLDASAQPTGYIEPGYADIELLTSDRSGSAMHLLWIAGGVDHPAFKPGMVRTFSASDFSEGDDLHVDLTACSGTGEPGEWSYDNQVDEVTVEVSETEDPEVVRVDYEGRSRDFGFGEETTSGTFLMQR